jgi:monoamine oxidase
VDIATHLRVIAERDHGKPRQNITILGAGMAGLVAGYELARLGHRIRILEGSSRVGGRVRTHRFSDGTSGELGPMRIPPGHDYTRYYVKEMGLTLRPFISVHQNPACFYDINGVITRMRDAPANLYSHFELSEEQRKLPSPPKMFADALDQLIRSLNEREKLELLSSQTPSRRVWDLDRIPIGVFLADRIGRGAAELQAVAGGTESALNRSLTTFLRDAISTKPGQLDEIVGGMDSLPHALARRLSANIEFETEVLGLARRANGVALIVKSRAETETELTDPVICTLPFTMLRTLKYGLTVSPAKQRAVRQLGYLSSTKVLLHASDRFWEKPPYDIRGGASQTDTVIRSIYYPSDFVRVLEEPRPTAQFPGHGLYTPYEGGRFESTAPPSAPGVLLGSYSWGVDARRIGAMPHWRRAETTIEAIARFHPEIKKPGLIDDHASIFWDEDPWMRGGAFSYLEPMQQFDLTAEAQRAEGNLYFAGEHCSLDNAWIQGAITSALAAVESIVSKP